MNGEPVLRVCAGVHEGAEIVLHERLYIIGSDVACDIVLLDDGVASGHVSVRLDGHRLAGHRLGTPGLEVDGVPADGDVFSLAPGSRMVIGQACCEFLWAGLDETVPEHLEHAAAHGGAPHREDAPRPIRWTLAALVLVLVLAAGGAGISALGRDAAAVAEPVNAAQAPAASVRRLGELRARVRESIPDDALHVGETATGAIRVSGTTAMPAVKPRLASLAREFKGKVEILDEVAYVPVKAEPKHIRMPAAVTDVHLEEPRWFRTSDGERFFEGAEWEKGVAVERITLDGIVFRRGEATLVYRFNG